MTCLLTRSRKRNALRSSYRGYTLVTTAPPSSGATLLETLNLLSGFDLADLGADSPTSVHLLSEAQRLADADRTRYVGDPSFARVPCDGLIAAAYADTLKAGAMVRTLSAKAACSAARWSLIRVLSFQLRVTLYRYERITPSDDRLPALSYDVALAPCNAA